MRHLVRASVAVAATLVICGIGHATTVQVGRDYFGPNSRLINFDTTPDGSPIPSGTLLDGIYAPWGVAFGTDDFVSNWLGIATSPPNRAAGSADGLGPLDCYFPAGVHAVGAYGFDFVLEAFSVTEALIYRVSYTDGTAGLYGNDELGFLGIASDVPIAHARFSRYWSAQSLFGYEIDDLSYLAEQQAPSTCEGTNVAVGAPATASAYWATPIPYPPALAVDGDTLQAKGWNAGAGAPQWIEVDLGAETIVTCLRLLPDMLPDGQVTHVVEGRTEQGTTVPLGSYVGPAAHKQWLTIPSEVTTAVRYVRVTTTVSPSWVAWIEVEVLTASPTRARSSTWGALKAVYR